MVGLGIIKRRYNHTVGELSTSKCICSFLRIDVVTKFDEYLADPFSFCHPMMWAWNLQADDLIKGDNRVSANYDQFLLYVNYQVYVFIFYFYDNFVCFFLFIYGVLLLSYYFL